MQGKAKVLVIDNGLGLAETARGAVESSPWELVLAASRGEIAGKVLTEDPEVIVLGYLEPQGETFRIHKQLKENPETAHIPQVVIDAAPEERATKGWRKSEGMLMEAEEYLCQPVGPEELGKVIERILARSQVADMV